MPPEIPQSSVIGGAARRKRTLALSPVTENSSSISTGEKQKALGQTCAGETETSQKLFAPKPPAANICFFQRYWKSLTAHQRSVQKLTFEALAGTWSARPRSILPNGPIYTILRDLPIAEAPRWIIDLAMPDERPEPALAPMQTWRSDNAKLRAVPGILVLVTRAREGERNAIVFWAGCRFGKMVADKLIG
jgi:hypothetical protein